MKVRSHSIMKKVSLLFVFSMLCLAMSLPAYAVGISKVSMSRSTSVKKNTSATYALALKYNTVVYNIPLPTTCKLGIELPQNVFSSVRFVSGSSPMSFTKCRGAKTGQMCYQSYKSYRVTGTATKSFRVSAKAVNASRRSGKINMGTGNLGLGIKINDWNSCFTVTTK